MRPPLARRALLTGAAWALVAPGAAGRTVAGHLPWAPNAGEPPPPVRAGPWVFFTPEEGVLMEAIADRLIPPDPNTPGGRDAGCAVFIDRQLDGPYGRSAGLYVRPPFAEGVHDRGPQGAASPAQRYRTGLAAIDARCRAAYAGKRFADLPPDQQDALLTGLQLGEIQLEGTDARSLFTLLLDDTRQGFFTDPVYGGNKDMAGWRMIGFPGARYDYSDWVLRHNERYPLPPVSIQGRADWQQKG